MDDERDEATVGKGNQDVGAGVEQDVADHRMEEIDAVGDEAEAQDPVPTVSLQGRARIAATRISP